MSSGISDEILNKSDLDLYRSEAEMIAEEFLQQANLKFGDLVVIGCSSSEIAAHRIGSYSNAELGRAVFQGFCKIFKEQGIYLAAQCCEHLNRVLVVERECMVRFGLTEVCVTPWLHAGGAFATEATRRFEDYVMVESREGKARAGIDIGGTFIGKHMHPVVVPIHAKNRHIGQANVTMARTRPKYVGGPRAHYPDSTAGH